MARTIIQTLKTEERKPFLSFIFSFLFTGLGQMYNGALAAGVAFCLMRALAILALPAVVVSQRPASAIVVFFNLVTAAAVVTCVSPVEALLRARRNRGLPVRAYTSPPWYALFAVVCAVITAGSVLTAVSFFSMERVKEGRSGPILAGGDLVLTLDYMPEGLRRGELALIDGSFARVLAIEGDNVGYEKNIFYINGRALIMGFLPDVVIARFTGEREDIISETNDAGTYPIRFRQSPDITPGFTVRKVPPGHLLVAFDARIEKGFARVVTGGAAGGRVEGILFSPRFRKIGMNAYGGATR